MNKRIGLVLALFPMYCFADSVVPIDKVTESVNIRLSPDASSEIVGKPLRKVKFPNGAMLAEASERRRPPRW